MKGTRRCALALALAAAGAVACAAVGPAIAGHAVKSDAASNQAAAVRDAAALLTALRLPPDARASSVEPAGDSGVLAHPASGPADTTNVVDDSVWWTVGEKPPDALAYIVSHAPPGTKASGNGFGRLSNGVSYLFAQVAWPSVTNVLSQRGVVVEAVALPDGSTGLRADSQVVWITPRQPAEMIPAGASRLLVSVTDTNGRKLERPFLVTASRKIRRVVALLNSLPLFQPGVIACPADFYGRLRLELYRRRAAPPIAVAVIDPAGCEDVGLTLGGVKQPTLTGTDFAGSGLPNDVSLLVRIEHALGRKIDGHLLPLLCSPRHTAHCR